MNEIKDLTTSVEQGATYDVMLEEMQRLNKIAVLKEEEYVIRSVLRGRSISSVIRDLRKKYPKDNIQRKDLDEFMALYKEVIFHKYTDIEKGYVRRLLKSQEGLTNELVDLAIKAKLMTNKYDEAGDNANAVGALRTTADIFMKFAKIQGLANDQPEINVNMQMDKVITEVTAGDSAFRQSVMNVINEKKTPEIIIDTEIINDDGSREG